jgi:hypothetical protein
MSFLNLLIRELGCYYQYGTTESPSQPLNS